MSQKNHTVSIIMNCFNGTRYLRPALDSILAQTYRDWELIFWDNQSSDDSVLIAESYQDSRIKIFCQDRHTTLYEARNLALKQATGYLIAFLDTDDFWEVDKLERQVPQFSNPKVGLVYGKYWFRDENRDSVSVGPVGDMPSGRALPALLKRNYVGILTMVVRRPVLQGLNGPFNDRYEVIGDTDFVLRVAGGWEIKAVEHPVATYRWHDSNDTKRKAVRHAEEWVDWLADISLVPWIIDSPGFEARRIMIYKEIARCIVQNKTCKPLKKLYLASQSWSEKLFRLLRVFLYVSVYLMGKGWPRSC
jgi:glycosyltransferase involved in cell wall biosynthesis